MIEKASPPSTSTIVENVMVIVILDNQDKAMYQINVGMYHCI